MRVVLLAPAPLDTMSGGYAYDHRIVAGLRAAGHQATLAGVAGGHPLPDAAARQAARAAWDALPADARPVLDGLALPAFADLAGDFAARRAVGLIHHPTALETGRTEPDRDALRATERRLFPLLDRIIVTSDATAERLVADFGVARARVAVVVPGTDAATRSEGASDGTCRVLSVGTLVPRKGHDVLLHALARLADLPWRLDIVGSAARDPAHAAALAALAQNLGIAGRVRFAGEADAATLETLWRHADVFALATHWEGYGMAVAEALKRGLPVAITAGGAACSLVPPEGGVACAPGDATALSLALRRLIFDADLRRGMAQAAWQAGQRLPSWDAQAQAFAAALA